jgi:hypothetical protein
VTQGFTELVVLGPDGTSHWEAGGVTISGTRISAPLKPLGPAGKYTIKYNIVSDDGHPVAGTITFNLTVAGPAVSKPAGPVAAPAAAAVSTPDTDPAPLWPWIAGGVLLLFAGAVIASRIVAGKSGSPRG